MIADEENSKRSVDLRPKLSLPRDQEREPTCVGFAMAALREYLLDDQKLLSPRYLYHFCKQIDGIVAKPGTYLCTGIQVLKEKGICEETIWPYKPIVNIPPSDSDTNALLYRGAKVVRLDAVTPQETVVRMKQWLGKQICFVAGLWIYESWGRPQAVTTGIIPELTGFDRRWGGHAICVAGYDDKRNCFIFRNSWGTNWGDNGYGYVSYEYMRSCCFEAWGIELG